MRAAGLGATLLLLIPTVASANDEVVIVQGRSVTIGIPIRPVRGTNSNPDVVEAVADAPARKILFFARKPGFATYTATDGKRQVAYDITVVDRDLHREAEWIQRTIGLPGVTATVDDDSIVVDGEVATEEELARVSRLLEGRENVVNLVELSPAAMKALARTIERQIQGTLGSDADEHTVPSLALAGQIEALRTERLLDGLALPDDERERVRQVLVSFGGARTRASFDRISARARMSDPGADADRLADRIADAERAYQDADRGEAQALKRHLDGSRMARYLQLLREFERARLDLIEGEASIEQ